MTPAYSDPLVTLYEGDCLDVMRELPDASVDAVVTDPPYGIQFMGRHWDHGVPGVDFWREMLRVLKPGGYLLSFAGTRTVHRFGVAIEDAGFEIRDTLMWIYASGFPKSLDVSKALDKVAGAEREPDEMVDTEPVMDNLAFGHGLGVGIVRRGEPATDLARQWQGWGTALKPAHEPIVMARKPLIGTVAQNVTRYGTGALNIDGARIGTADGHGGGAKASGGFVNGYEAGDGFAASTQGRWPSNVLLSSPELFDEPNPGVVGSGASLAASFREGDRALRETHNAIYGRFPNREDGWSEKGGGYGDSGGYSRFFRVPTTQPKEKPKCPHLRGEDCGGPKVCRYWCHYIHTDKPKPDPADEGPLAHESRTARGVGPDSELAATDLPGPEVPDAEVDDSPPPDVPQGGPLGDYPTAFLIPKADRAERERGLAGFELKRGGGMQGTEDGSLLTGSGNERNAMRANTHPTVKPIDLMRHLVRLVTPPGGTVLDPFAGSGTTGLAASEEGFRSILIEREAEYVQIILGRLMATPMGLGLFSDDAA